MVKDQGGPATGSHATSATMLDAIEHADKGPTDPDIPMDESEFQYIPAQQLPPRIPGDVPSMPSAPSLSAVSLGKCRAADVSDNSRIMDHPPTSTKSTNSRVVSETGRSSKSQRTTLPQAFDHMSTEISGLRCYELSESWDM